MGLQERVEQLEKQNRSLKTAVRFVVWIVVIVGGYLGYQEANRQFSDNRALMSAEDAEFRLFATTDGVGRGLWVLAPRAGAEVVSKNDSAGMYLYELDREGSDEEGHSSVAFGTRAKFETNSKETFLALYDKNLRARVHLHVTNDGPALVFYDEDGKTVYRVPQTDLDAENP